MSLWYKEIDQITFDDVDAFCQLRQREGIRLDYKLDVPKDLEKLVASFANTLGGLILLGVDADRKTNEPVWPPTKGMPTKNGIEEQIVAICRDNIYPPVRPQISSILDNRYLGGHVLVVVRVDESAEAPHAINNGRRVYERTGNQNRPIDLAQIDRIERLLGRRQKIEQQREFFVQSAIKRARSGLGHRLALRWASAMPVFPWRDLCDPQQCRDHHTNWQPREICVTQMQSTSVHWDIQRAPGGSFAVARSHSREIVASSSITARGHLFAIERTLEIEYKTAAPPPASGSIDRAATCEFAVKLFEQATSFYRREKVEKPGLILLSIGLLDVHGKRMVFRPTSELKFWGAKEYPDEEFRAERVVHLQELLDDPQKVGGALFDQLAFAFDTIPTN
jgi:hypothetical protein